MKEKEIISEIFDGNFMKSPFKIYTEELAIRSHSQIIFEDMIDSPEYYNEFVGKVASAVGKGIKAVGKGIGSAFGNLWSGMKEGWKGAGVDTEEEARGIIQRSMTDGRVDKKKFLEETKKFGIPDEKAEQLFSSIEDKMGEANEGGEDEELKDDAEEEKKKKISKSDFPKAFDMIRSNIGELKKQAASPEIKSAIDKILNKFPNIPEEKRKTLGPVLVGMASYFSS